MLIYVIDIVNIHVYLRSVIIIHLDLRNVINVQLGNITYILIKVCGI